MKQLQPGVKERGPLTGDFLSRHQLGSLGYELGRHDGVELLAVQLLVQQGGSLPIEVELVAEALQHLKRMVASHVVHRVGMHNEGCLWSRQPAGNLAGWDQESETAPGSKLMAHNTVQHPDQLLPMYSQARAGCEGMHHLGLRWGIIQLPTDDSLAQKVPVCGTQALSPSGPACEHSRAQPDGRRRDHQDPAWPEDRERTCMLWQ